MREAWIKIDGLADRAAASLHVLMQGAQSFDRNVLLPTVRAEPTHELANVCYLELTPVPLELRRSASITSKNLMYADEGIRRCGL